MKKICFILTAEFAVRAFLLNHLRALSQLYQVTVIVNTDNQQFLSELGLNVKVIPLPLARKISIISDLQSLIKLIEIFNREKFSAVHSITPKAGLLGMLAGLIVGVPLRIHTFTGQVWANKSGIKRFLLKKIDWFIGLITTDNLVDGRSQLEFLIQEQVLDKKKSLVFLNGSIAGVDIVKFSPNPAARIKIRDQLGIHQNDILFVYIGRLNRDKGVIDLVHSFNRLRHSNAHLIFVGPDEENMRSKIEGEYTNKNMSIHFVEYTKQPQDYMAAADVLCLPSYREGFNNVIIEAAAVGIPSISSRIYGIVDCVEDNVTGLLHNAGDIADIQHKIELLIDNPQLRSDLGTKARIRVINNFDSCSLTKEWVHFYEMKLSNHD